jgi:hypothetical protein
MASFTAVKALGSRIAWQLPQGADDSQGCGNVRIVLVGEVVGVNHLWLGRRDDSLQVFHDGNVSRILDCAAGVIKEDVRGVIADESGFLLFLAPDSLHFLVRVISVETLARAAAAVSGRHSGETLVRPAEALEDAVIGHNLDVVLMGRHAEVRGSGECNINGRAVRDIDFRSRIV